MPYMPYRNTMTGTLKDRGCIKTLFVLIHPPCTGSGKAGFVMSKHDLISAAVDTKDHYAVKA